MFKYQGIWFWNCFSLELSFPTSNPECLFENTTFALNLVFSPKGPPRHNDRGECCAPFIPKTYQKHTLEDSGTNFGRFGNFSFLVKFWLMTDRNTRKLSKVSQANSGLTPSILSMKYSRKRLRQWNTWKKCCLGGFSNHKHIVAETLKFARRVTQM